MGMIAPFYHSLYLYYYYSLSIGLIGFIGKVTDINNKKESR